MTGYSWVATQDQLGGLVADLVGAPRYGLDTEFIRERTYYPRLALVQVAWPAGVALVDPMELDLRPLAKVLDGPGLAVLHAAEQDLEVLDRACGTVPARLFDTQVAASFLGMSGPSLASLVERVLGRTVVKGDRLTDWTHRPLTVDQQDYAASDVIHLLDLHDALAAELSPLGRLGWAEAECELLRQRSRSPVDPNRAWWRLRDARALRGRSRNIAQAVAAWRERKAASLDRPPRHVFPDLALVSVAHKPPGRPEEVGRVRGLEGRHLKRAFVSELLEAVAAGKAMPDDQLCLPAVEEVDRKLRPAVALAAAWVGQRASELRMDPMLLATRADLQSLIRGGPSRLGHGWRADLLGVPLRRLIAGQAALALAPGGGLALEERSFRPLADAGGPTGARTGAGSPTGAGGPTGSGGQGSMG